LIPSKEEKEGGVSNEHLERLFVFTLMWSVGAFLEWDDRVKMEEFMRNHESKLNMPTIPDGSQEVTMFDFFVESDGEDTI
jgi:dynein heavy chain